MNRYYSSIRKQLVREFGDSGEALASVNDLVIDVSNGNILAVVVVSPFGALKAQIILPQDILKWSNALYIEDANDICEVDDIVRLRHIKDGYVNLFRFPVYTESGDYLGDVIDYIFDDNVLAVTKLIVGDVKFFGFYREEKMRIKRDQIIRVDKEKIIVKDLRAKELVEEEETLYNLKPATN